MILAWRYINIRTSQQIGAFRLILTARQSLLAMGLVYLRQNSPECILHIRWLKRRRLNVEEALAFCELLRIFNGDSPLGHQVRLVANKNDRDVFVGMLPQLLDPSYCVLEGLWLCDVIHHHGPYCTAIVCTRNSTVPVLWIWNCEAKSLWKIWFGCWFGAPEQLTW